MKFSDRELMFSDSGLKFSNSELDLMNIETNGWRYSNSITHKYYGALLVPYTCAFSFILGMYPFFHSGEHFLTFGATFFSGVTFFRGPYFFCWRNLFLWLNLLVL